MFHCHKHLGYTPSFEKGLNRRTRRLMERTQKAFAEAQAKGVTVDKVALQTFEEKIKSVVPPPAFNIKGTEGGRVHSKKSNAVNKPKSRAQVGYEEAVEFETGGRVTFE